MDEPRVVGDRPHGGDDAGHERRSRVRVRADGQGFAVGAEEDLLVGVHALLTDGVDVDSVDDGAACTLRIGFGGVGNGRQSGGVAGCGDALGRVVRRAGRGVEFAGVVDFDDFGRVEVGGREFGEAHGQDGTDREVRGDEDCGLRVVLKFGFEAGEAVVVPSGGADDGVDVVFDEEGDGVLGGFRHGEFDGDVDVGIEQGFERIAAAECRDEFEAIGAVDRVDGVGPHPTFGSDDGYANAHMSVSPRVLIPAISAGQSSAPPAPPHICYLTASQHPGATTLGRRQVVWSGRCGRRGPSARGSPRSLAQTSVS